MPLVAFTRALESALLSIARRTRHLVLLGTALIIVGFSIPRIPRQYIDLSRVPLLCGYLRFYDDSSSGPAAAGVRHCGARRHQAAVALRARSGSRRALRMTSM